MIISLAAALFAASTIQPPAAPAPVAVQWDTINFAGPETPAAKARPLGAADTPPTIVESVLRCGGLLGGGRTGVSASQGWTVAGGTLVPGVIAPDAAGRLQSNADVPAAWHVLNAAAKETAGAVLTVDLNALRSGAEAVFDAPWLQRTLDRLALDNARLVSLRATVCPPPADNLPPLLSVKAFASARSVPPGPAKAITLVAPGWQGSATDAAAMTGARWAAAIRFDSAGLGVIGRDGGVGTLAGVLRLFVDAVGTANTADTSAWAKDYAAWQERSSDALRSLSTRMQQRGTLGCYGLAAAPDLVLVIPSRRGERADTITKAMEQLAAAGGLASKGNIWSLKEAGPLTPRLAVMVCDTASGPWLVITLEHGNDHALLQQTASRMRLAK